MKAGQEASGKITGPHPLISGEPAPAIRQSYPTVAGEHRAATYELSETIGAPQLCEYTWVSDQQVDADTVRDEQSDAWTSTLMRPVRQGSMAV